MVLDARGGAFFCLRAGHIGPFGAGSAADGHLLLDVHDDLDVLDDLLTKHQFKAEDVEEVNCSPSLGMLMTYRARGTMDIAFSLAYMLSIALLEPKPGPNWHTDEKGWKTLQTIVDKIKKAGVGRDFDCIIGVSGGIDSSYLTYITKEKLGLRPFADHST